jgi:hypothetical protein
MLTRNAKFKDKDLARKLDEIRQLNKKNHQAQRQQEEEEAKRQQDEDAARLTTKGPAGVTPENAMDDAINNFASKVHNIMNGMQEMETSDTEKANDDDLCSPPKKRHSTKTSAQRNPTRHVSPTQEGQKVTTMGKTTTFLENFIYPHSRVVLELAVVLKSDKAFEEFTQALMAFLSNAQIVDPKFVVNPLHPNSKEKKHYLKS